MQLKEDPAKKVVVVGQETPNNNNKNNNKPKRAIGRGFIVTSYWRFMDAYVEMV